MYTHTQWGWKQYPASSHASAGWTAPFTSLATKNNPDDNNTLITVTVMFNSFSRMLFFAGYSFHCYSGCSTACHFHYLGKATNSHHEKTWALSSFCLWLCSDRLGVDWGCPSYRLFQSTTPWPTQNYLRQRYVIDVHLPWWNYKFLKLDYKNTAAPSSIFHCVLERCDISCKCFLGYCNVHDDLRHSGSYSSFTSVHGTSR